MDSPYQGPVLLGTPPGLASSAILPPEHWGGFQPLLRSSIEMLEILLLLRGSTHSQPHPRILSVSHCPSTNCAVLTSAPARSAPPAPRRPIRR
jgi:hypothetical protein